MKVRYRKIEKKVSCSKDLWAAMYCAGAWDDFQEKFSVALMTNKNEVKKMYLVSIGTIDSCNINPSDVFRPAILEPGCSRIAICHNHPSGDPTPSPEDIAVTKRLCEAGALLGISVIDHIIIGAGNYSSLRDLGMMI